MKIGTSCLLLGACLLTGCWQKSVHPFYERGDVAFDEKLFGSWREAKDTEASPDDKAQVWSFSPSGDMTYKLEIKDGENTQSYEARLFKLDGQQLLDIQPTERTVSTIPAHNLFKVVATQPKLELAALNIDWVQKWLRQNPEALAHFAVPDPEHRHDRDKDELVLSADTKALQKFLREHLKEDEFFGKPQAFKKH